MTRFRDERVGGLRHGRSLTHEGSGVDACTLELLDCLMAGAAQSHQVGHLERKVGTTSEWLDVMHLLSGLEHTLMAVEWITADWVTRPHGSACALPLA